jgi:hypothetical protein
MKKQIGWLELGDLEHVMASNPLEGGYPLGLIEGTAHWPAYAVEGQLGFANNN